MKPVHVLHSCIYCLSLAVLLFASCKTEKSKQITSVVVKDTSRQNEAPNPYATFDQSPMDMCYYPPDYPILKMNGSDTGALVARVIYSRPKRKGRTIFGTGEKSLITYGKEWRLGANEATELEFFKDVYIAGTKINKGRYIIYCIPFPDKWTILLNGNLYTWGLHMDASKDMFKTDIAVTMQSPALEDFTMVFQPDKGGAKLIMAWDIVQIVLPIQFQAR